MKAFAELKNDFKKVSSCEGCHLGKYRSLLENRRKKFDCEERENKRKRKRIADENMRDKI